MTTEQSDMFPAESGAHRPVKQEGVCASCGEQAKLTASRWIDTNPWRCGGCGRLVCAKCVGESDEDPPTCGACMKTPYLPHHQPFWRRGRAVK